MPAEAASSALSLSVLIAAGILGRVLGILGGAAPVLPEVSIRIRIALAVTLTAVALPLAMAARGPAPTLSLSVGAAVFVVVGEAAVGLALGAALAALVSAGAWAGSVLGSVAGLAWADDFDPDGGVESAGCARFAWWTSAGVFLAAGGLQAIIAGTIESLRVLPIGMALPASGLPRGSLDHLAADVPAVAFALALSLAVPALLAVLAFHLAAAITMRTVPFAPGSGLLQGLAAVVLLGALFVGADAWSKGFPDLVQGPIERVFGAH